MCKVDGSGDCRRRNILYHNSCDNCRADNAAKGVESTAANTAAYWGESFRSASERSLEHLQDYRNKKEESHMWRHKLQAHPDEEVSFTMKVVKRFHSSFERNGPSQDERILSRYTRHRGFPTAPAAASSSPRSLQASRRAASASASTGRPQ